MKKETVIKWALGLLAAAIISPVIFMIVKGMVGLALAAIVGLAIVNFAPVVGMSLANGKLAGIKWAARRNPIETLQNQLRDRRTQLIEFAEQIKSFSGEVKTFKDKVTVFERQQPENAGPFKTQLAAMETLLDRRRRSWEAAKNQVDAFEVKIGQADQMWQMSQAAQKLNRFARKQGFDAFEKIKTDVALDEVMRSVNLSFAEVETALMVESPPAALEHIPADPLQIPRVTDVVEVPAKAVRS